MDNSIAPGRNCIGVGVGAMVFDDQRRVFMARRGVEASNEVASWEFPGGTVIFGERLQDAVRREFREEYGMEIRITALLGLFDHILPDEHQHWVSVTYLAEHIGGTPEIRESDKCSEISWCHLRSLPGPLSKITRDNIQKYWKDHGPKVKPAR